MRKTNSTNYVEWFKKAGHDLEDAVRLLHNDGYADTICFLSQQAVEKALKGYLVYCRINPRAIHQLEDLARDCAKINKDFLKILEDCFILTRYYIETRYPPVMPIEYKREEAQKAVKTAEKIMEFVKEKIT